MKITLLMFMIILVFLGGCNDSVLNQELGVKIYKVFFEKTNVVEIIKEDGPDLYRISIKGKDLNELKKQMKNITEFKEYSADYAPFGEFKENFRLLFVWKGNTFLPLLYSTEEGAMIVRKKDVYPDFELELPNITVLEFNISQEAILLLEKHEKLLPENGYYYTSWPGDYLGLPE